MWKFKEGYEEYHDWDRQRRQERRGPQEARVKTDSERAWEARRASEREAARRARCQAELEQMISQLELRRTQLEAQLAIASERQEVGRVRQLGAEYRRVEVELDTLLAAWADVVA